MTCATEKINGTEARKTFEGIVARKRAEQAASEWIKGYDYLCYEGKTGGFYTSILRTLCKFVFVNILYLGEIKMRTGYSDRGLK